MTDDEDWLVVIELIHDMGAFESTKTYREKEADDMVMKLRNEGINCYRKPVWASEIQGRL